jgi:mono/diheme cytochrome c family protein
VSKQVLGLLAAAVAGTAAISVAAAEPPPRTPELVAKGKVSFERNCTACHGEKGEGDGPVAESLDPKPRNLAKAGLGPREVFKVLETGKLGTAMTAFTNLPEEERWAIAYYVDQLAKSGAKRK